MEYRQLRSETGSTTPNPVSTWQTFLSVGHVTFYRALKVRVSVGKDGCSVCTGARRNARRAYPRGAHPTFLFPRRKDYPQTPAFANARRGIVKRHGGMHHYPKWSVRDQPRIESTQETKPDLEATINFK